MIPQIVTTAAVVGTASAAVAGLGLAIVGIGSALDAGRVIIQSGVAAWNLLSGAITAVTGVATAQSASQTAQAAALATVTTAATAATTATASYSAGATVATKITASLTKTSATLTATFAPMAAAIEAAAVAMAQFAAAATAAQAVGLPLLPGKGGKAKRGGSRGTRGPRKNKETEVATGEGNQSLIIPGRSLSRGRKSRPVEQQDQPGPAGLLAGPASSIVSGVASEVATVATVVTSQTSVMTSALAGIARVAGVAGGAIQSVFTGIAAGLGTSVIAVVAAVAAIGAGVAYIAARAGILQRAWSYVTRVFNDVSATIKQTVGGITAAIQGGRWDLAMKIAWTGAKLVTVKALDELIQLQFSFAQNAINAIIDWGIEFRNVLWEVFKSIPKLLKSALTGGQSLAQILNEAITGKLGSPDSLLGKTKAQLQKELDDLTAQASKLGSKPQQAQVNAQQRAQSGTTAIAATPAATTSIAAAPGAAPRIAGPTKTAQGQVVTAAPTSTVDSASTASAAPDTSTAAADRIKALREEIMEMERGAAAAELFKLAQQGATMQELKMVAILQQRKAATEKQKAADEERKRQAEQARQQMIDEGKAMTEAMMTPMEKANAEIQRIKQLQSSGAIDQQTAGRAIGGVLQQMPTPGAPAGNSFARAGSAEANQFMQQQRDRVLNAARAAQGQRMAAANAGPQPVAVGVAGQEGKTQPDQELLKLQQSQLRVLQEIQKGIAQPTTQKRVT